MTRGVALVAALWALGGCGGGGGGGGAGVDGSFPADVATAWHEARDCRFSHEHDLLTIRVWVNEEARRPYERLSEELPYPVGSILVKGEYDDEGCTTLTGYTSMAKLAPGESDHPNDWLWRRLGPDREILEEGAPRRCVSCHQHHCPPPFGFDLTCAEEL